MATSGTQLDPRFQECRERCTFAFATATIFQKRARRYSKYLRRLTFLGLALPLAIGGVVGADLLKKKDVLAAFIWIAGIVGVVQLVVSLWSVVARWPENLEASLAASSENSRLTEEFDALAKQVINPPLQFGNDYSKLITQDNTQRLADEKQLISDRERMYGHRAALRQFSVKCSE